MRTSTEGPLIMNLIMQQLEQGEEKSEKGKSLKLLVYLT